MYKFLKKTIVAVSLFVCFKDIKSNDHQSLKDIFIKLDIQDRLLSSETILERLAKNKIGSEFLLNCLESISKEEFLKYSLFETFPLKKLADILDKTCFETLILNKLSEKELKKLQARFSWASILSRSPIYYPLMKRACLIPENTSFFKSLLGQEKLFSFIK